MRLKYLAGMMVLTCGSVAMSACVTHEAQIAPSRAEVDAEMEKKMGLAKEMLELHGTEKTLMRLETRLIAGMRKKYPQISEDFWVQAQKDMVVHVADLMKAYQESYASRFTLQELESVVAFNKTPAGKSIIEKTPLVTADIAPISTAYALEFGGKIGRLAALKKQQELLKQMNDVNAKLKEMREKREASKKIVEELNEANEKLVEELNKVKVEFRSKANIEQQKQNAETSPSH